MPIHETAIVSPSADVHPSVDIGPFVIIEGGVKIGEGSRIAAHAVMKTGLEIGKRVVIHESAVLGGTPQDLKFAGEPSRAVVGDDCVIREFATIHRSARGGGTTRLGRGCFLMAFGHIAHDCTIGDGAIIASYVALAGHVVVGDGAFISGGAAIHQHSRIGELSMIGGGSKVNLDVPPFVTVDGVPAAAVGLNKIGLRRNGASDDDISQLKLAYRTLFRERRPRVEALELVEGMANERARRLAAFVRESKRGVCRNRAR